MMDTRTSSSRQFLGTIENKTQSPSWNRLFWMLWLGFFLLCASSQNSYGQVDSVALATATPVPGGHDYIQFLNETVNPANGSVSLRINMPTPKGRGLNAPVSWSYDSAGAFAFVPNQFGQLGIYVGPGTGKGGWAITTPSLTMIASNYVYQPVAGAPSPTPGDPGAVQGICYWETSFVFTDFGGQRHSLPLLSVDDNTDGGFQGSLNAQACQAVPSGSIYPTLAGSDGEYQAFVTQPGFLNVTDASGTVYEFAYPQAEDGGTGEALALLLAVEDRNGNEISNVMGLPDGSTALKDTLGRTVYSITGFPTSLLNNSSTTTSVQIAGVPNPYTATWTGNARSFSFNGTPTNNPSQNLQCGNPDIQAETVTDPSRNSVVSTLALPNGQQYQFQYDPIYGLLSKVTYPNGGYIQYDWGINAQSDDAYYQYTVPVSSGTLNYYCHIVYDWPAIQHRYVSYDGTHVALQQDFSYTTTFGPLGTTGGSINQPGWTAKTTTVVSKDLVSGTNTKRSYAYSASPPEQTAPALNINIIPHLSGSIAVETQVIDYDQQGNTLQTINQTWGDSRHKESETLAISGLVDETDYQYGQYLVEGGGFPGEGLMWLPSETDVYGFGGGGRGSLLEKTTTNYATFQPGPLYPNGSSLLDFPSQITTYDGGGNVITTAVYCYDQTAVVPVSGIAGRDDTNYGSSYNVRGNLTQQIAALQPGNQSTPTISPSNCGQASTASSPSTTYTFDQTGQPLTKTDPKGNVAQFSFADAFRDTTPSMPTNAYLSKVSAGGLSNAYTWDYATGKLGTTTDQNGLNGNFVVQTFQYNDSLNRLTEVDSVDGGKTTYAYTDGGANPTIQSQELVNASATKTSTVMMDGTGHPIQTQLNSDPIGTVYSDTVYDGNGRVYSASNPYRSQSDPSYGVTQYSYDPLGRKLIQANPDGTTEQWCYNGIASDEQSNCRGVVASLPGATWVDFADESGSDWQHASDALGRLVQVSEPMGLLTSYGYDLNGNLLSVNQFGNAGIGDVKRTRSFSFDSFSRLLSANNPETGTITYSYTANSGLCAGDVMLPCSKTDARGIATNYTYDGLNRLTNKTYSDGVTPEIFYIYDIGSAFYSANFTAALQNAAGRLAITCVQGNHDCTTQDAFSYDRMGRITNEFISTPSFNGGGSPVFSLSAGYDLLGDRTDLTYPSGRHIQQSWDSAGRLSSVNLIDVNGAQPSPGMSYLQSAAYAADGTPSTFTFGNGLEQNWNENNRQQVAGLTVTTPLAPFNSTPLFSHSYCYSNCTTGGARNNGNIWGITDNLSSSRTQGFTYDALNRITGYQEGGTQAQQYATDSFGNLSSVIGSNSLYTFDTGTNRVNNLPCASVVSPFDAAGNQTCWNDPNGFVAQNSYDGESRLSSMTAYGSSSPFESYLYDGDGRRSSKTSSTGDYTEYIYFEGQPVAEHNSDETWSDYIFAGGKRIARADNFDVRVHLSGTNCNGCGSTNTWAGSASLTAASGYTIRSGDKLAWRQYQDGSSLGGINISFTSGTDADGTPDQSGIPMDVDTTQGSWHQRIVDLSSFAGLTIKNGITLWETGSAPAGNWDIYFGDIALTSQDGSVISLYDRVQGDISPSFTGTAVSNFVATTEDVTNSSNPNTTNSLTATTFYLDDHLGTTSTLASAGGWPLVSSQFSPFGTELNQDNSPNHYKFTGKERDAESGLDYFGARYYAASMRRWMSPDWSAKEEPVPYAKLGDPQSLNLYSYVYNNPLSSVDPDGHCPVCIDPETEEETEQAASEALGPEAGGAIKAAVAIGSLIYKGYELSRDLYNSKLNPNVPAPPIPIAPKPPTDVAGANETPEPEPQTSTSGGQKGTGKNGLPPGVVKLKGDQGYKDKEGNIWKKDKLHKDHWDVTDKKGKKIKEITFDGKQIWPDGPKNKNK